MVTEFSWWDLVFRLTIFSLLAYKLYALARQYLIPFLYQQIALEHNQQTEILEKEKLLISTRHRIENQIYNQKKIFTLLERNVQVWHKNLQDDLEREEKDNQMIANKVREKRLIQLNNIALKVAIEQTIPRAVSNAGQQLFVRCHGTQGQKYLKEMIERLGQHVTISGAK